MAELIARAGTARPRRKIGFGVGLAAFIAAWIGASSVGGNQSQFTVH